MAAQPAWREDSGPMDEPPFEVFAEEEEEEEEEQEEEAIALLEAEDQVTHAGMPDGKCHCALLVRWPGACSMQQPWRHCSETSTHSDQLARDEYLDCCSSLGPECPLPAGIDRKRFLRLELLKLETGSLNAIIALVPAGWTQKQVLWTLGLGFASSLAASVCTAAVKRGGEWISGLHSTEDSRTSPEAEAHADRVARDIESGGGGRVSLSVVVESRGRTVRKWKFRVSASAQKRRRNR